MKEQLKAGSSFKKDVKIKELFQAYGAVQKLTQAEHPPKKFVNSSSVDRQPKIIEKPEQMSRNRVTVNEHDDHDLGYKMLRPVLSHKVTHLGAVDKGTRGLAERRHSTEKAST